MTLIDVRDAETHLARLLARAEQGEEIVIAREGKPVAKLVPVGGDRGPRPFDTMRGLIEIGDDFDAPLPPDVLKEFGLD